MKTVRVNKKPVFVKGKFKLINARSIIQGIEIFYTKTNVRTTSGDIWDVMPDPEGKADYVVVK